MTEVFIRYTTTAGIERCNRYDAGETTINLDLKDIVSIDLLPLIWCQKLEYINLRHNQLSQVDLSPISKCKNLRGLRLSNNCLEELDLSPLGECEKLKELLLRNNPLTRVDLSPLFHCPELVELEIDDSVSLTADMLLRSFGSWPEVLLNRYHRILWKASE